VSTVELSYDELLHEYREQSAEIARHHDDFANIRAILEPYETGDATPNMGTIHQIRRIVG
jgi:hypothetical protein